MAATALIAAPKAALPCVVLIGMAGAGKTTVGSALAQELDWAFVDSDHLIEAVYGARLQDITDALGKRAFLDAEATVVCAIRAQRTVIATGGSVVYRPAAMAHLASLGPLVFLDVPFQLIEERVARNPERGIAMNPGESLRDIFDERQALYSRYARVHCPALESPQACARWIRANLPPHSLDPRG
ncbi:homoserine kinase [Desulfovibrio legallii]|jgi:shikimate kinase|nr:homoserine kinase [Desulfovibrio legallii]CAI3242195.1 Shikimate kinase I (EC [Desulfovibrio diazotrophicus]